MAAYNRTYDFYVAPTLSQQFWEPTPYPKPLPPHANRRKPGRPKRNRRKNSTEGSSGCKLKKTCPEITCSRCGLVGNHNSRGCMNQGVPQRPKNWVDSDIPPEGTNANPEMQADQPTEFDLTQNATPAEDLSQPTTHVCMIFHCL
jgi:hypothetical protein